MNITGFDDCMKAASEIQSNSEGKIPNHLGNRVNSPTDTGDHISQFNAGLDAMQTLNNDYIPLSEFGGFKIDLNTLSGVVDILDTWLKNKLMSENGYKSQGKKSSDYSIEDKTGFLKEMAELFRELPEENKQKIIQSLSSFITSYGVKTIRGLISKLRNISPVKEKSK